MTQPVIGILEAGANSPEYIDRHGTMGNWFERFLATGSGGQFATRIYPVYQDEFPEEPGDCDGYMITGSVSSVIEDARWMQRLQQFARTAADNHPVVGICFGHQLIAAAFGGTVEVAEQGWGIGAQTYHVRQAKSWMSPAMSQFTVLASHMDQVTELPPTAELLAGNDFCPHGMMQIGDNVLSLQTHPEITKEFFGELYHDRRDLFGEGRAERAIASLEDPIDADHMAGWIAGFLQDRISR